MPKVKCPFPNCDYTTDDVSDAVVTTLLTLHANCHNVPSSVAHSSTVMKVEKVKRPTVTASGTSEEWNYFLTRWEEYVMATQVTHRDRVIQLLECCDEPLRKDLTRSAGGSMTDKDEATILAAMKKLAVRQENPMVARVVLHDMRQDRDEAVRSFGARIRGQAGVCQFSVDCPQCQTSVDYTECILRDVLAHGLADADIQLDLLGDSNQNMEEVFKFVESKESGKRSALRLHESQGAQAATSTYRRAKRETLQSTALDRAGDCSYCGPRSG